MNMVTATLVDVKAGRVFFWNNRSYYKVGDCPYGSTVLEGGRGANRHLFLSGMARVRTFELSLKDRG